MATVPQKIAADLADKMFGFGSKVATGEMSQQELDANGHMEWPLHYAIAEALGGTVRPFDQYQGPYVLIGEDRLWVSSEDGAEGVVYNEDNGKQSQPFLLNGAGAEEEAVAAAEEVLQGAPEDAAASHGAAPMGPGNARMSSLNSPLEGKSARMVIKTASGEMFIKTADGSMLGRDDQPSSSTKLQQIVGDPMDQPISAFAQFWPNIGTMQMPNPLSPIEGDACFFTYMVPGAVFQSHDGQQWDVVDYNGGAYGVLIQNRWYPRLRAWVNLDDVRRSIHSWVEPVQVVVPPPPPGVNYVGQPVRIVDGKSHA